MKMVSSAEKKPMIKVQPKVTSTNVDKLLSAHETHYRLMKTFTRSTAFSLTLAQKRLKSAMW